MSLQSGRASEAYQTTLVVGLVAGFQHVDELPDVWLLAVVPRAVWDLANCDPTFLKSKNKLDVMKNNTFIILIEDVLNLPRVVVAEPSCVYVGPDGDRAGLI